MKPLLPTYRFVAADDGPALTTDEETAARITFAEMLADMKNEGRRGAPIPILARRDLGPFHDFIVDESRLVAVFRKQYTKAAPKPTGACWDTIDEDTWGSGIVCAVCPTCGHQTIHRDGCEDPCHTGTRPYFERPDDLGNWLCCLARDGGGWTKMDSGVAPDWRQRLEIKTFDPGSADDAIARSLFYIDGVLVANIVHDEADAPAPAREPVMRFRFHRGSLADSMATERVLSSDLELLTAIADFVEPGVHHSIPTPRFYNGVSFKPYGGADARIGWKDTFIVSLEGFGVVGFADSDRGDLPMWTDPPAAPTVTATITAAGGINAPSVWTRAQWFKDDKLHDEGWRPIGLPAGHTVLALRCNGTLAVKARRLGFDKAIEVDDTLADDTWSFVTGPAGSPCPACGRPYADHPPMSPSTLSCPNVERAEPSAPVEAAPFIASRPELGAPDIVPKPATAGWCDACWRYVNWCHRRERSIDPAELCGACRKVVESNDDHPSWMAEMPQFAQWIRERRPEPGAVRIVRENDVTPTGPLRVRLTAPALVDHRQADAIRIAESHGLVAGVSPDGGIVFAEPPGAVPTVEHPGPWTWGTDGDDNLRDANGECLIGSNSGAWPCDARVRALTEASPELAALLRRHQWSSHGLCPECSGVDPARGVSYAGHKASCAIAELLARIDERSKVGG